MCVRRTASRDRKSTRLNSSHQSTLFPYTTLFRSRAVRVYVHGKPRILAHQRAGSAGMVQMNVRQKNGVEIAHTNASGSEALAQSLERRTRAGIDNGAMPVRFK